MQWAFSTQRLAHLKPSEIPETLTLKPNIENQNQLTDDARMNGFERLMFKLLHTDIKIENPDSDDSDEVSHFAETIGTGQSIKIYKGGVSCFGVDHKAIHSKFVVSNKVFLFVLIFYIRLYIPVKCSASTYKLLSHHRIALFSTSKLNKNMISTVIWFLLLDDIMNVAYSDLVVSNIVNRALITHNSDTF